MTPYVLVVITYLAGSTWGPVVSMQSFSTQEDCEQTRKAVETAVADMNRSNLTHGAPSQGRKQLVAFCRPQ